MLQHDDGIIALKTATVGCCRSHSVIFHVLQYDNGIITLKTMTVAVCWLFLRVWGCQSITNIQCKKQSVAAMSGPQAKALWSNITKDW